MVAGPTAIGMPSSDRSGSSRRSSRRRHRSSRGASRSGHHRHRRSRRGHRFRFKQSERNWIAAIFDLVVMAVIISALADQSWFRLHGGKCPVKTIGVYKFFFSSIPSEEQMCYSTTFIAVMRSIISLLLISLGCTLFAFVLDTLGPGRKCLKIIRRHGVGNILSVFFCVTTCGFCYWAAVLLEEMLDRDPIAHSSKTTVTFDTGYFLMVMSGSLSVLISATNLLWPHPLFDRPPRRERLIDDWEEFLEHDLTGVPPTFNVSAPPPPEYTP